MKKRSRRLLSLVLAVLMTCTLLPTAVLAASPLTITKQPENVEAAPWDTVTFTVSVSGGTAPYTYQWECTWDSADGYVAITEVDADWASGYDSATLQINVYDSDFTDHYQYRCVITDADGNSVTTSVAAPVAPTVPVIRYQPENVEASVGDTVYFYVAAFGGTEPYTYQWECTWDDADGYTAINEEDASWASGYDADVLSVTVATDDFDHNILYRCVITDADGNAVTTDAVRVVRPPLRVATQPENTVANVGDTVTFTVAPSGGVAPYTYQWEYMWDGQDGYVAITESDTWAAGYNTDTLSFAVIEDDFVMNGQYRCVITDSVGNTAVSLASTVTPVGQALTIREQPQNTAGAIGEHIPFSVSVVGGTAPYTYQWQAISDGDNEYWDMTEESWCYGVNTREMTIILEEADFEYHYTYRCVITDADGNTVTTESVVPVRLGDVNEDETVDNRDVTMLLRYLAGWDIAINESAADVNADDVVDNRDVTMLLRYLADWDVTFA